jgi:single-stranded DNA-binding protein
MNHVVVMGRLGKNLELKTTDKGPYTFGSIAVDESYKDKNGVKVKKVVWVPFTLYGSTAENCVKFAGKAGNRLLLTGKIDEQKGKDDKYSHLIFKPLRVYYIDWNEKGQTQEPETEQVPF